MIFLICQKIESGRLTINPTLGNLNDVIREIVEELRHQFVANNQDITLELEELPVLRFDKNRISQVLINLLSNARKFSSEGQSVTVKTWCKDKRVYVSVTDQGLGIAPEDKKKMFKMFSSIERTQSYVGSGLGLSISKKIIELHNGTIWVDSEGENKGSTFSFYLPLEEE